MSDIGEILEATQTVMAAARQLSQNVSVGVNDVCEIPMELLVVLNQALLDLDLALGAKVPFEPEDEDFPITWGGPMTTPEKLD